MKELEALISELENKILKQQVLNKAISTAPVGWHIQHSLLTIMVIIERLKQSDPKEYYWKFNWGRLFVFAINKIPRGAAQSPDVVKPKGDITVESLTRTAGTTREKIKQLKGLHPNNYFVHPYFGKLNFARACRFLRIHTKHHLTIINDIIGK